MREGFTSEGFTSFRVGVLSIGFFIAAVIFFMASGAEADDVVLPQEYAPGEILVQLSPAAQSQSKVAANRFGIASLDAVAKKVDVQTIEPLAPESTSQDMQRIYRIRIPESQDLRKTIQDFRNNHTIAFAEANAKVHAHFTPNDTNFADQWNFTTVGAQEAWDYDTTNPIHGGDSSVVVAVLDTGVAYRTSGSFTQAPDLASTTFATGKDFVAEPDDSTPDDDNGHGTHVTGTIAENTNNSSRGAGLAFNSTIMPVKVLDNEGSGLLSDVALGVDFARSNGADIINMSLGSDSALATLETAITNAVNAGILVVASTGNSTATQISYPARYDNVIAVGATGFTDAIASYSNTGTGIDLVAPGGDGNKYVLQETYSSLNNEGLPNNFSTFGMVGYQGTSQAAPHVTAAAALLLAFGTPASQVESILETTTVDLGAVGYDTTYGNGRLDIAGALAKAAGDITPPTNPNIAGFTDSSQATALVDGERGNSLTPYFVSTVDDSDLQGYYVYFGTNATADPETDGTFQTSGTYQGTVTAGDDVSYYLRAKAKDNAGNISTGTAQFEYRVDTVASPATNVGNTNQLGGTSIFWTNNDPNLSHNILARASSHNGFYNHVNTASGATYMDNTPQQGETWYYVVAAVDDLGNIAVYSNETIVKFYPQDSLVMGTGQGSGPQVTLFRRDGTVIRRFFAYDSALRCGVNVGIGDLDGDGVNEIVTGAGAGCSPQVRVFDQLGRAKFTNGFYAYEPHVKTGVFVAVGDLDGDGVGEIVTGNGPGGGPQVRVFNRFGTPTIGGFFAYDKNFRGGVYVATADFNGNGQYDIVTGVGVGGGPHVRTFNNNGVAKRPGFMAYSPTFNAGVHVGAGDVNGDGKEEIITGSGPGGSPQVRLFSKEGNVVVSNGWMAYASDFRGGIFVDGADTDQDGTDEVVTSVGSMGSPTIRVFEPNGSVIRHEFLGLTESFKNGVMTVGGILQ